jgi:hypothetical protein
MADNIEYLNGQITEAQPELWYDDWGNMTCTTLNGGIPHDEWPLGFYTGAVNSILPTGPITAKICKYLNR